MSPTLEFRWVETSRTDDKPVAVITTSTGLKYFKLQQRYTTPYVEQPYEWRDVEVGVMV